MPGKVARWRNVDLARKPGATTGMPSFSPRTGLFLSPHGRTTPRIREEQDRARLLEGCNTPAAPHGRLCRWYGHADHLRRRKRATARFAPSTRRPANESGNKMNRVYRRRYPHHGVRLLFSGDARDTSRARRRNASAMESVAGWSDRFGPMTLWSVAGSTWPFRPQWSVYFCLAE